MAQRKSVLSASAELLAIFILLLLCWGVGAVFYHVVEGLSYVDAIYFTAMTLTTVGYGDIAPVTDAGKIFTAVYVFIGIGSFLGFAAALVRIVLEGVGRRQKAK